MNEIKEDIYTPAQISKYLKHKIDSDTYLQDMYLMGEVSNFKAHSRGHFYFTLKDEESRISAIMFSSNAKNVNFLVEDGMKVIVRGNLSVYVATGTYQIYVKEIREDGVGNLYLEFEKLKKKLQKEGLFDIKHKKEIPKFPKRIGIVTANTGAAIRDILSTIKRRYPLVETILFPSLVQGEYAAENIVENIKKAEDFDLDTLIVGRGGGSIEDLWPFNEEIVARAIYESSIPVISAVGHEVDFTISDFVADKRAATPTAAAEIAVPNKVDLLDLIKQLEKRLIYNLDINIKNKIKILEKIKRSRIFLNPRLLYLEKEEKFSNIYEKLLSSFNNLIKDRKNKLLNLKQSYIFKNPKLLIEAKVNQYNNLNNLLKKNINNLYKEKNHDFRLIVGKLDTLSPLKTLSRGYTITKLDDKIVKSINEVEINDLIDIELNDGYIKSKIVERKEK